MALPDLYKPSRAYLDWASAAPVHETVSRVLRKGLLDFGNPSSPHEEGKRAADALEEARTSIARLLGAKSRNVIFTSGATEANNLAILGRVKAVAEHGVPYEAMHILYLPTMHASVIKSLEACAARGVRIEPIALAGFAMDLPAFLRQLTSGTILVCADAVCGETGVRFDTLALRRAIDATDRDANPAKAVLHVDASQLPLIEPIERSRLGADLLVLDAQKVGGVRGIGALAYTSRTSIAPILEGGGQEEGLRPGTEPVALAVAFAAALEVRGRGCEAFSKRAGSAREDLVTAIAKDLPDALINQGPRQAPHILSLSLPGLDTDYAVMLLNEAGYAVSTKSACETDSENGSRAVIAYTNDEARAQATLRMSWGPETSERDLRGFLRELARVTRFLRS